MRNGSNKHAPFSPKKRNSSAPRERDKLYRYAYARVTVTVLSAILFAGLLISVANDMYAFVKPQGQITLTVAVPLSLEQTAEELHRLGIIQNPTVFRWYVTAKQKRSAVERFSGTLTLSPEMSYRELLRQLSG